VSTGGEAGAGPLPPGGSTVPAAGPGPPVTGPESSPADGEQGLIAPQYRYAAVLGLNFVTVVFLIAAPGADWSKAVALGLEGVALVVTVGTSRQRPAVRRRRAIVVSVGLSAMVVLIALGVTPQWMTSATGAVVTAAVPVALVRGLLRLLRDQGVTLHALAGSLAIYLSIGLMFAWIVGFIAQVTGTPYFSQNTSGTQGEKVYFSFTVLTTTGFGDYTPAHPAGHALAVIEMLVGQIYLVTVIGLLIGNFAGRARTAER
jgi:Ion channel